MRIKFVTGKNKGCGSQLDTTTAKRLCALNNDFYLRNHDTFSATRQKPWDGWNRCLALLEESGLFFDAGLTVFDLACGNLRFKAFLSQALPTVPCEYFAVDNCAELIRLDSTLAFQNLDILSVLLEGGSLTDAFSAPACKVSACFGFMHHVPQQVHRLEILRSLIRQTQAGGYVLVSFWQFLNNQALKEKAEVTHARALQELGLAELDDNDYLLGWKDLPGVYRYCHSFTTEEIDELVKAVESEVCVIDRFISDGRTDNLNTYLVLQVNEKT